MTGLHLLLQHWAVFETSLKLLGVIGSSRDDLTSGVTRSRLVTLKVETRSSPKGLFRGIIDLRSLSPVIFFVDGGDDGRVGLVGVTTLELGILLRNHDGEFPSSFDEETS